MSNFAGVASSGERLSSPLPLCNGQMDLSELAKLASRVQDSLYDLSSSEAGSPSETKRVGPRDDD